MESLITDLGPILGVVPALIIKLTNDLKWLFPSWFTFILPYIIAQAIMIWLRLVFNEQSLWLYMINGVVLAYGAVTWYEFAKNWIRKNDIKEQIKKNNADIIEANKPFIPQD